MFYRTIGLLLTAILSGCGKFGADDMAQRYERIAETHGTNRALCREGNKVADAFALEGDEAKATDWRAKASMACVRAELGGE